ncbi:MAG: MarC family protein [Anaerolineaceae bacterium]|nr:MAG: MarC family protein [Anaerolineaceae bacterium]
MSFFPLDIFMAILITMGPLKVVLVYGETTRTLSPKLRRSIAIKAVGVAAIVGLLFIVLGKFLLDLFHFSIAALTIAGGAILFVFAINMVLSGGGNDDHGAEDKDPTKIAIFPLAMPLIATPIGIVYLTVLSVTFDEAERRLIIIALLLLFVMLINLGVLLGESKILKYIDPDAFGVAERILGILLAALAVQTIINGLRELGVLVAQAGHG